MLKSLDVLIGLIVVLLALSMAVTVVTQAITTIINSRGRHLRRGLSDLLQQLDPALTPAVSKAIATNVLTHPLVSGSNTPLAADGLVSGAWAALVGAVRRLLGGPRLGTVVHREEFTKLLMLFATGNVKGLEGTAERALQSALASNGVTNPDEVLKNVRMMALQLEQSHPELSNTLRQNMAILAHAKTDFVAKVNSWFDQTMDRTSQRFTASTRAITFAGAFVVAFGLQVDTPQLVNRLAADDALRETFLAEARVMSARPASYPASTDAAAEQEELSRRYQALLTATGVIALPTSQGWQESFKRANVLGLLLTALLLSLGAPFWYSALGKLLQLRSVLAAKDDAQRTARQTSEPPPIAAQPGPPP